MIQKTARRIAAELVLMPEDRRGGAYSDDYLKQASGCRVWTKLQCAHCDCWKVK